MVRLLKLEGIGENMNKHIANELIKKYRIQQKITQAELSKNICTQSIISKIEKNEIVPSVIIFFQLAKRLSIPGDEIIATFELSSNNKKIPFYSNDIKKFLDLKEYSTLRYVLSNISKENIITTEDKLYYEWLQTELLYRFDKEVNKAKKIFKNMLEEIDSNREQLSDLYSLISLSLAEIYYNSKELELAKRVLKEVFPILKYSLDISIFVKVYKFYAEILKLDGKLEKAFYHATLAIEGCIEKETLNNLAQLYYFRADILYKQGKYMETLNDCEAASILFKIQGNNSSKAYVEILEKKVIKKIGSNI